MILAGLLGVSCDSLDVVGMFVSSGPSTEDRVEEWLAYNEANGMTVIDGVPDTYSFYACSDLHVSDSTTRLAAFLDAEYRDNDAIFSIIMGDLANKKGEEPYRNIWNTIHGPRPYNHVPAPMEDTCFAIIGNHDIYFDCYEYYKKYFHTSTYSVVVRTVSGDEDLFIFMDSGNATLGSRQIEWLRRLLAHRSEYRHCIVCTHTSFFRTCYNYSTTPAANLPEDEYYEMIDLLSENEVDLFMMGHFHYRESQSIGGVEYVMTDNLNEEAETPTYLVVTCGKEVSYRFREL